MRSDAEQFGYLLQGPGARQVQVARVAHGRPQSRDSGGVLRELADVQRDQIPVLHPIAEPGQPQRIAAGAAPDVGDQRRGGRRGMISVVRANSSSPWPAASRPRSSPRA